MNKNKILLFIPTLNEEKHITKILKLIDKYNDYLDLLIIDDNSTDNTVINFCISYANSVWGFENHTNRIFPFLPTSVLITK